MKREDLIRELKAEMGGDDTDIDGDELPGSDEVPHPDHYSEEMLIEQGRLYGILDDGEGIEPDDEPLPRTRGRAR